jgi:predicted PurR-regulated permease PerM
VTLESIVNLELGWAIGLMTGMLAFLPYIGGAIGVLTMFAMALVQFQLMDWQPYIWLAAIFCTGQILEGYVLTPKLVGNRVGLHPLWVMFALLAGGAVGGIIGLLMALPVAVVISVVLPRVLKAWRISVG